MTLALISETTSKGVKSTFEQCSKRISVNRRPLCPSERMFCGDARNWGVSVAKGDIIAFIDTDCVVDDKWVNQIIKAHQSPDPAIGGAIANGEPSNHVGWAGYFCEFSEWMPETPETFLNDVAGASMSYKRRVFEEVGPFIEGTYCSDTDFHWRLGRVGHRIRFVPSILVYHHRIDSLPRLVNHEYHHGRSFARVRIGGCVSQGSGDRYTWHLF
jgi:GT2 family glycosyltransferase